MIIFLYIFCQIQGKESWGDNTPTFFNMISTLLRIFPNAKFIHIVRDGRDVYLSRKKFDPTKKYVSLAAVQWKYWDKKIRSSMKKIDNINKLEIKYEDLTKYPEEVLYDICQFLKVDFENNMLNFYKDIRNNEAVYRSNLIFNPITTGSIGKWRTKMTDREIREYEIIAGNTLNKLGYDTLYNKYSLIYYFQDVLQLFYLLPLRLIQRLNQIFRQKKH